MIQLVAGAFLWVCGSTGLCLDLAGQDIHWPSIETQALSQSTGIVFPVILNCRTHEAYYLEHGLAGQLATQPFDRGTIFDQLCERAFGEEV